MKTYVFLAKTLCKELNCFHDLMSNAILIEKVPYKCKVCVLGNTLPKSTDQCLINILHYTVHRIY